MKDLTAIFLTINRVPEKWAAFHKQKLLEAIKGCYLITVSAKPMDMPGEHLIQEPPFNASNIYKQMLRAAKIAQTKYVAVVEDDSLYPHEHFHSFRPKDDEFGYNMTRWAVFTWGKPTYFWRNRLSNLTLLAPRDLLIQCLEERFAKYPEGTPEGRTGEVGKERIENLLGLPRYKYKQFWTTLPVINLNHIHALDPLEQQKRKRLAPLRAFDVPYWGPADELVKHFV